MALPSLPAGATFQPALLFPLLREIVGAVGYPYLFLHLVILHGKRYALHIALDGQNGKVFVGVPQLNQGPLTGAGEKDPLAIGFNPFLLEFFV